MGAEIITMGMGMRGMPRREALFLLGVVRRVRSGMIGRMMFPVSDITLSVLSIGFTGMMGGFAGPGIPFLSWRHTIYFACSLIKQAGGFQENREKNQVSGA